MHTESVVLRHIVSILAGLILAVSPALAATPVAGPNVNMVTGTQWPAGDPLLTKQNEPSIAVSSVNPRHLLAGANDYRLVDPAIPIPGDEGGDAWVTLIKSTDGGITWRTSLIPGCPLNIPECNTPASPVKGLQFAADPTVRPGPYGTFFYSFIAGNRGTGTGGVTAVQRIVDQNTAVKFDDDPFFVDGINILDVGTTGQFKDKPWNAADVPGRVFNTGTCVIPGYNNGIAVPAFNVYVSFTNFVGQSTGNPHPQILVARSTDCGATFGKPVKLSQSVDTNSGSQVVIEPQTGTVYVVWRRFADPSAGTGDAVWMSYSPDGGNKWVGPTQVASIIPYDQGDSGTTFRTNDTPAIAVSVDSTGTSRLHVAFSQRKAAINPVTLNCTDTTNNNCDARLTLMSATITKSGASTGALGPWQTKSIDDWQSDVRFDGSFPGSWPAGGHRRGHQFMPALTFAGGKLMAVWLDQRYDHTIGRLVCTTTPTNNCDSLLKFSEIRVPAGNLVSGALATVFTPFITDGTSGLARRHTLDVFGAMASVDDPTLTFTSTRISRYAFGALKAGAQSLTSYTIDQLQSNPPNLPIAAGGTIPFIGDYTDVAAQIIVPTGNALQPYAFNCGPATAGYCANVGTSPAFYPAWTDNRDVVRPKNGDWTNHTPIVQFGSSNLSQSCVAGQDGTRNSNVYTALVGDGAVAYVNANSKALTATTPRGFVIGVQNLIEPQAVQVDTNYRSFVLTIIDAAPSGGSASFDPVNPAIQKVVVSVPPASSASRSVWVKSNSPGARVRIDVAMILDGSGNPVATPVTDPDATHFTNLRSISQIVLNPDPKGTLLGNADGTNPATTPDVIDNNQGIAGDEQPATVLVDVNPLTIGATAYALSNAGTTNLALNNLALNNYALNNLALNNYALSNLALNNLALNNYALNNYALNNATDYNYALSNYALSNYALNNVTVDNTDITNLALNNYALNNYALNNYALSNNSFSNLALNNQSVVDTTVTITNDGNTDTTLALKTLLNSGNIPPGMSIQLMLRKVALSPAASVDRTANTIGSCTIAVTQQNSQVASFAQPTVITPTDAGLITFPSASPADQNADPRAATLPLAAKERAYVTLRVVGPSCTIGQPVIGCATYLFAKYGTKIVAVDASKTTTNPAPTQVPLVITSFNVISMAGSNASLTATGGAGALTWAPLANPPSDVTPLLGSDIVVNANGSVLVGPNVPTGDYILYVTVTDTGAPGVSAQYDQQRVTLRVFSFSFPGEVTFGTNLPVGGNIALNASTVPPIPISYSLGAGSACHIDNSTNPAQLVGGPGTGTCVLIITIGDSSVLQTVTLQRTYTVKAGQTITFGPLASKTYGDPPFAVSATASSGLPVTLAATGNCTLSGSTSPANVTLTGAGSCSITASQAGDANTFAAAQVTQSFAIAKAAQTFALTAPADGTLFTYGNTVPTITATSSAGLPVSLGATGNCSISPATSPATLTLTGAGSCTLTVSQAGDANYLAATVARTYTIAKAAQTIALTAPPDGTSFTYGDTVPTITATSSAGLPVSLGVTGNCSISPATSPAILTLTGAGSCTLTASQAGNANYLAATVIRTYTIAKAAQTITFPLIGMQTFSPGGMFGVSATASSQLAVSFGSLTTAVCTVSGSTVTMVAAGTCTLTADQAGNGNYNPAPQQMQSFTIAKAAQTITFAQPGDQTYGTAPFQVTATASSNLAVTFVATGSCTVSGTGSPPVSPATVTLTSTGTCTVTASQSGNGSFNAAPDVARTFAIDLKDFYTLVGSMAQPRSYHTATRFESGPLAGWVLIAGGLDASGAPTATTELYNPVTRTFAPAGNMPSKSAGHTATLLANGMVLGLGGGNASAEIFDPVAKTWSPAGSLSSTRSYLTATVLGDGTNRVFVAGGVDNGGKTINSTILYNPSNGTFANGPNLTTARERHTATLLPNGKVLIVGGRQASGSSYITLSSAEICNATACTALVSSPSARYSHAAVALPNGTVLLAGGSNGTADLATAEILDPTTGGISPAGLLQAGRRELTATGLPNGRALEAGGQNATGPKSASDLYKPPLAAGAPMNAARAGHTATPLKDAAGNMINVLIVGGVSGSPAKSVSSAEIYGWIGP